MELASDRHIVVALHWAHQTIISGIDLLYYGYFDNNDQTETDMLGRVWGFIKECFDASQYNRKRRTGCTVSLAIQTKLNATTESRNCRDALAVVGAIKRL